MSDFIDFYALLEISVQATEQEIRRAIRMKLLHWHPDRNPDSQATAMTQRINLAKSILIDDEKRQDYNQESAWRFNSASRFASASLR